MNNASRETPSFPFPFISKVSSSFSTTTTTLTNSSRLHILVSYHHGAGPTSRQLYAHHYPRQSAHRPCVSHFIIVN